MKTICTNAHIAHKPGFEFYDGVKVPYAETADRVDSILAELGKRNMLQIAKPIHFARRHIEAVHQTGYIEFVRQQSALLDPHITKLTSYFISDTYAPLTHGTYEASVAAVDVALTGAQQIIDGEIAAYSLCRPPGHHAAHHSMGGYCYFNNAAIAANYLSAHGRVAVLDIDYHHGNGTQEAFYERDDVLYVSLHADPVESYPYITGYTSETGKGQGAGFNVNYPLDLKITNQAYLNVLQYAISEIESFVPDYLVISAGFDTYKLDPIGGLRLTKNAYKKCGTLIAGLNLPTLIVQEGGYNIEDLGCLVSNFLGGFPK